MGEAVYDPERGQLLYGAGRSMLARNPERIGKREFTRLHANFLMHGSDAPRRLRFIDDKRHNRRRGVLRTSAGYDAGYCDDPCEK